MPEHTDLPLPRDAIDELVSQLLSCGAALSQMISRMVQWEAAGRSAPDAAPIPTVAHELIVGVLSTVRKRHSRRDLKVAAAIVEEVSDAICGEIFFVPLKEGGTSGINGNAGYPGE